MHPSTAGEARRPDRGITLIEVLVALTILSIVLIALGGLMFQVGRRTTQSSAATYRTAVLNGAAAWIQGLPWDSLNGTIGCTSDSSGLLAFDQCVSILDTLPRVKRVTVVINPTGILTAQPDTVIIYRNRPRPDSPLK